MYYYSDETSDISKCLKLLKIHKTIYRGGFNGSTLKHHIMILKHGLKFLEMFLEFTMNGDLSKRIRYLVSHVNQKLFSLTYDKRDKSLEMNIELAYTDMREEMKNVIFMPGTNEYDVICGIFTLWSESSRISLFLCEKIKKLVKSDCKAGQITPIRKELDDVGKMLTYFMGPIFEYAENTEMPWTAKEDERKRFTTITTVLHKATCFIYLSFVGNMDDEMVNSLKNCLSDLFIEETQIMKTYLSLDTNSIENLKSHISTSLRLLEWNKNSYLGTEIGLTLEDHFMSIKYGLQFLGVIFETSRDIDLKLLIQQTVTNVKQKVYSIPHYQDVGDLITNLEHAYGELRGEMQNVFIKKGTDDCYSLFPEIFRRGRHLNIGKGFLLEKISKLVSSRCKADKIAPMMTELTELSKKLTSLKPLFEVAKQEDEGIFKEDEEKLLKDDEEKVIGALSTFLDRATCLIYLSFVGKLNEDMLLSVRKSLSLLIDETEIKEMSLVLGIICEDLESNIDASLSLLKMQEDYYIGSTNEAHIISLKHGIQFLKWIPKICIDRDLEWHISLLARNVKQKLESLTYEQGGESLNIDVNCTYGDLREEMKNVIINPTTNRYGTLFPKKLAEKGYLRSYNDFLLEKITILVTSYCTAGQIAPLKKELHDLRKMLSFFKPLGLYGELELPFLENGENIFTTLLTVHHNATFPIYLIFIGKMDVEMVSNIPIKETDIWEMYTMVLKKFLFHGDYLKEELYILENLILLLKSNIEFFNDANSVLYEGLIDIHIFLLGLSPNMFLRKLHLLEESFDHILGLAIPIICSCYLEPTEVNIPTEVNCVLQFCKSLKSDIEEVTLNYFPKTDGLGFLEFFLGYLEDLMNCQEISLKEEIDALHFEMHTLLSLAKENQELTETPWIDILKMAYQAEYIIDLFLVSSSSDMQLMPSLSKIIQQLKNIRSDVHGHCCNRPSAQNVSMASKPQVLGNDSVVGLQEETRIITEYLLMGENSLDVISIVGMPGIGKTTLALSLYSTYSIADHFCVHAWCSVSQSYQNRDLFLSVLDQVNASDKSHRSMSDDQELADHFCRSLKKRRYLIVLDDIWDTRLWSYLKHYLPNDRNGSRILITTRNRDVADQIGSKVNELHGLSEKKSLELFHTKMLEKESLSDELQRISKGIVEQCKGLPLSIVIMAGILSDLERTKKKWNQVAESVSSLVLSDIQGKCKAILELSYNHLPNHLKSCFLYLGIFPEDEEIDVDILTCLWIGEGFVRDKNSDCAEEVARKYIEDLIIKSLVIPAKKTYRGGVKSFRVHDLLRDFCLNKAKEERFFMFLGKKNCSLLQDPRRLVINGADIGELDFSCHSIRSMICLNELEASEIEKRIEYCDMVLLKVLLVIEFSSDIFPNISSLVHLRFLAMSFHIGKITYFPSSLYKLHNLQILLLDFPGDHEFEVPDLVWDMVKLRHFGINPGASFQVDSNRLQNSSFLSENLRSLSKAIVSRGDSEWLSKLPGLQRIVCVFVDDDLEDEIEENQFQMLSFNDHLTSLRVENESGWDHRFITTCQLPISLRKLTLSDFFLASNDISEIGRTLPLLLVLKIYSCSTPSDYVWNVDDDDFPELKVLKLRDLKISNWFTSENSFQSLEELWVKKCDCLEEIPLDFGYLPKLQFISVGECSASVEASARQIEKLQHEDQNTEMKIRINSKN